MHTNYFFIIFSLQQNLGSTQTCSYALLYLGQILTQLKEKMQYLKTELPFMFLSILNKIVSEKFWVWFLNNLQIKNCFHFVLMGYCV